MSGPEFSTFADGGNCRECREWEQECEALKQQVETLKQESMLSNLYEEEAKELRAVIREMNLNGSDNPDLWGSLVKQRDRAVKLLDEFMDMANNHPLVMAQAGVHGVDRCHRVINKQQAEIKILLADRDQLRTKVARMASDMEICPDCFLDYETCQCNTSEAHAGSAF